VLLPLKNRFLRKETNMSEIDVTKGQNQVQRAFQDIFGFEPGGSGAYPVEYSLVLLVLTKLVNHWCQSNLERENVLQKYQDTRHFTSEEEAREDLKNLRGIINRCDLNSKKFDEAKKMAESKGFTIPENFLDTVQRVLKEQQEKKPPLAKLHQF